MVDRSSVWVTWNRKELENVSFLFFRIIFLLFKLEIINRPRDRYTLLHLYAKYTDEVHFFAFDFFVVVLLIYLFRSLKFNKLTPSFVCETLYRKQCEMRNVRNEAMKSIESNTHVSELTN